MLALFFLTVLFLLAQAFQKLLPTELNSALRFKNDTVAYFVADAAVQDTVAWAEYELENGRELTSAGTPVAQRTGTLGDWSWTATVSPDAQTPPNGLNPLRMYKIVATASYGTRAFRRVTTWVGQQSFAKFVLYSDKVDPSGWWNPAAEHYDGPFHLNDPLKVFAPAGLYGGAYAPLFTSTVTCASASQTADGVQYAGPSGPPYDSVGNPRPGYYERLYAQGRQSLRTGVRRIELPPNTAMLANAAWGDPHMAKPSATGVYVNTANGSDTAAGGVYVVGTVDSMLLSVDGNGNRSVRIAQGTTSTIVTETLGGAVTAPNGQVVEKGRTMVVQTPGHHVQILRSSTNGVVFSTGSVQSLQGVNKGARTIATDVTSGAEIVVGGSITRSDTTPGQAPQGTVDNLGLVAYRLRVPATLPRSQANPIYVYAAMLAGVPGGGGGSVIDNWSSGGIGRLEMYGSLSVSVDGVTGVMDGQGTLFAGYVRNIHYDPNLALQPPPYFPSFAKLTVRSWKEEALGP